MKVEYDPAKRLHTLEERKLDFENVADVLEAFHLIRTDDRRDYDEVRYIVLGALADTPVVCVWTPRGEAVRVISMRIADYDEREIYYAELERSR